MAQLKNGSILRGAKTDKGKDLLEQAGDLREDDSKEEFTRMEVKTADFGLKRDGLP